MVKSPTIGKPQPSFSRGYDPKQSLRRSFFMGFWGTKVHLTEEPKGLSYCSTATHAETKQRRNEPSGARVASMETAEEILHVMKQQHGEVEKTKMAQ